MKSKYKIGDKRVSTTGLEYQLCGFEVVDKVKRFNIKFTDTGYTKLVQCGDFVRGSIKDLLSPSIVSVGYIGVGQYTSNGDDVVCYQTWNDMLKRCYSPKSESDAKIYYKVAVAPTWHNYQVFAEWFYSNYTDGYRLDKDLLVIGNKEYSPDTCCFVPIEVNSFLTGKTGRGIYYCNRRKKWVAECCIGKIRPNGKKRSTRIGTYKDEMDALAAYKKVKLSLCDALENKYPNLPSIIFDNIRIVVSNII